MKSFKQVVDEARVAPEHEKKMIDWARHHYDGVAHDLHASVDHRMGDSGYHAAHDHVTDSMYDQFHHEHPKANFRSITKKALKGYVDDDRAEARAGAKKFDRELAAKNRPPKAAKQPKTKKTWYQEMGYIRKPRRSTQSR